MTTSSHRRRLCTALVVIVVATVAAAAETVEPKPGGAGRDAGVAAESMGPPAPKPLVRSHSASTAQGAAGGVSAAPGWIRTTGSLAAVVSLIVLLAWGYRKAVGMPASTPRGRNNGLIEVVSRSALSPRHPLWLLRVGPRLILVGGGSDGLRTLDVIQDGETAARLLGAAAQARSDGSAAEFARTLAGVAAGYEDTGAEPQSAGTVAAPRDTQAASVKARLTATLNRLRRIEQTT